VLPDATSLYVLWWLLGKADPTIATLEVRNLRVTREPTFPPYAALTAAASLSADGRKLYLIVFNKHHADDITTTINLDGVSAQDARIWTVTAPSLDATNLLSEQVRETVTNAPLALTTPEALTHTFPAHSMSAIEFSLQSKPPQILISESAAP
jgi:alpha-L-arabinofuranosidase